jgi:hypothetical protein
LGFAEFVEPVEFLAERILFAQGIEKNRFGVN